MKNLYDEQLDEVAKVFKDKNQSIKEALTAQEKEKITQLNESHEAEIKKMKTLFDEQLKEIATAFRQKNDKLQGQLDKLKKQIASLLAVE